MDVDAILLARIQFAFTVTFHIIFPSFSIGLAAFIATLLVRWRMTGEDHFHRLARFWTKIFAVSFAMGVVSGIVLSYQFGTNWAKFSVVAGNIMGPLLGYEVLTAFFLEATFLGIMLFGWQRVPPNLHVLSAVLVAVGTSFSAFWILSANSWMQTPAGIEIKDGIVYPVSWFEIVFNPSFPYRFAHMFTAAYLTTSVVVLSVGARYLVQGRFLEEAKTMVRMGLGMVAILAPLQLVIGDAHGLNTAEHQPAKIAAMEGHWDGSKPGELLLFAWPDEKAEKNHFEIGIPHLASLIITHSYDGLFKGLKDFKVEERPPILPVFFAFRVMVGVGMLLIAIGFVGAFLWWRRKVFSAQWYLRPLIYAWPLGFIAIVCGWWVTETGRQPYLVYGILKTMDAVSPVAFGAVLTSLILFVLIYTSVFSMGILYINRLIDKGPEGKAIAPEGNASVGARPIAAAQDAARSALGSED
ncbi:Cytochrome bd ubiquinol oxidase, subunit I (cydA, QxtA) [Hyphomicrobium sp. GJ21]|jgi:cytochrome d ubiquinol oxidase subunit I|uniref:cytochrome ubiquinol oxidase subunit I n=1 Tax=Hyphomicrobium sp. GJ21 TaxID=113574 RepID=UPI000622B8D9|nr:cytochrome ubiquinol oxidase subunit I [Hyphomicrobium sp. GJ21]CEJ83209.1 Cytochrome bd ubiquinol oxidase, subunit I (cydA, QxtA) [Hyphomicrobium sp. GJ21]